MLSAIIVAAGSSTRVGFDKVFAQIARRPVLQWSLEAFEQAACVEDIVIVCHSDKMDAARALAGSTRKVRAIVAGGARRQDSVQAGFDHVNASAGFVAVHDAARPLITPVEIERVFSAARDHGAAVLASPVTDTLKLGDEAQLISGSVDRAHVFAMQTPQIFRRELLVDAFCAVAKKSLDITDEVSAVQLLGAKVAIVPARERNLKITFADDLRLAELIIESRHPERSEAPSIDPGGVSL